MNRMGENSVFYLREYGGGGIWVFCGTGSYFLVKELENMDGEPFYYVLENEVLREDLITRNILKNKTAICIWACGMCPGDGFIISQVVGPTWIWKKVLLGFNCEGLVEWRTVTLTREKRFLWRTMAISEEADLVVRI